MKLIPYFFVSAMILPAFSCNGIKTKEETRTIVDTVIVPSQDPPYDPVMIEVHTTITRHADGKSDTVTNTIPVPKK